MSVVINDNKKYKKIAVRFAVLALAQTVALLLLMDQFAGPYAEYGVFGLIAMEWLGIVGLLLLSKSEVILDAEGVTFRSAFGEKTRPWSDVSKYIIEVDYKKENAFSARNVKTPCIQLTFQKTMQYMRCYYREDVDQCIRRFYGAPDVDKRT